MNNDNQTTTLEAPPEVNPFAERAAQEAVKPKKASVLSQVTVRKRKRPIFMLLYGPPGVGKSTLASGAPKPIFISTERGLDQLNCAKLPAPRDFAALYAQVDALDKEEHDYQTLVLDTIDGAELLIFQRVMNEGKVNSVELYGGGYGKGYQRARELWVGLLNKLTEMSERFNIILIAHSMIKTIADPALSSPYDCWQLRVQERSAAIVYQAVDMILFGNLDTTIQKDTPKARKGKGIVSGDRLLWTEPSTGIVAKNRFELSSPLEFSWAAVQAGIDEFYAK
jgi:DNA polymerase III delta prime subunit